MANGTAVATYTYDVPVPPPEDLERARQQGANAADSSASTAPDDPVLRIAWALGFGAVDQVQAAVDAARAAQVPWKTIGAVTGDHWQTARTKYGGGYERQAAYRARKREKP